MTPSDPDAQFATAAQELTAEPGVTLGQKGKKGFGSSALQVDGKIFAMLTSAKLLVVKLPRARVEELVAAGKGRQFDPGHGRLMKEWLVFGEVSTAQWLESAREALRFVGKR